MNALLVEAPMDGRRADELAVGTLELLEVMDQPPMVPQLLAGEECLGAVVTLRHLGGLANVVDVMLAAEEGVIEHLVAMWTGSFLWD
jgi:hypothetical protein